MGSTLFAGLRACYCIASFRLNWWQALAGAAAQLAGSYLSSQGQADANKKNLKIAREQMAFQERMSNTSYQRGLKDMQAAGLNPMLAYSQGGASSPSGSSAVMQNAQAPLGQGIASSAQQAVNVAGALQQISQSEAQTKNLEASTREIQGRTLDQTTTTARQLKELEKLGLETDLTGIEKWLRDGTKAWAAKGFMADQDSKEFHARREEDSWKSDVERRKAESRLTQLEIPRSEGQAKFYDKMESMPAAIKMLLMLMQMGSSARSAIGPR